jgi:hypothetical protein
LLNKGYNSSRKKTFPSIYFSYKVSLRYMLFFVCLMVFNATFNNISVISRRSVLLVEETGGPRENHWPVASHWQTLSHNVVLLSSHLKSADHASYKDDLLSWHPTNETGRHGIYEILLKVLLSTKTLIPLLNIHCKAIILSAFFIV